jgi:hypothetical protein
MSLARALLMTGLDGTRIGGGGGGGGGAAAALDGLGDDSWNIGFSLFENHFTNPDELLRISSLIFEGWSGTTFLFLVEFSLELLL